MHVGGEQKVINSRAIVLSALSGCVKDVRVGNGANALLHDVSPSQATPGCVGSDACAGNACGAPGASCEDVWNEHECSCPAGSFGAACQSVCGSYDPCSNNSQCVSNSSAINR